MIPFPFLETLGTNVANYINTTHHMDWFACISTAVFISHSFHPSRSLGIDFPFRSEQKSKTGNLPWSHKIPTGPSMHPLVLLLLPLNVPSTKLPYSMLCAKPLKQMGLLLDPSPGALVPGCCSLRRTTLLPLRGREEGREIEGNNRMSKLRE